MNKKEFGEYLESIGGLINGWNLEDSPIISDSICECSDGWLEMIRDLIQKLIDVGWNKEFKQIKEKFGTLRFYTGETTEEQFNLIREYEKLSATTCEICGKRDDTVGLRSGGWLRTLCEEHAEGKPLARFEWMGKEVKI